MLVCFCFWSFFGVADVSVQALLKKLAADRCVCVCVSTVAGFRAPPSLSVFRGASERRCARSTPPSATKRRNRLRWRLSSASALAPAVDGDDGAQATKLQKKLKELESEEHKEYKKKQKDKRASSGDASRELQLRRGRARARDVVAIARLTMLCARADGTISCLCTICKRNACSASRRTRSPRKRPAPS